MKKISIVTNCYNEKDNVVLLYKRVKEQMDKLSYDWDLIYEDNASADGTIEVLKQLALNDKKVKVIINTRNFGCIRSPHNVMLASQSDAVIFMVSDLQDPPELLPQLIERWEEGYKIVLGQKNKSKENPLMYAVRKLFYGIIRSITDDNTQQLKQCTGFGLYDKKVIDIFKSIDDPYPYLRGLICEVGYSIALVEFTQPRRKNGFSKNKFYTLYDFAMLGIVKHSRVPLRMIVFIGVICSLFSLLAAFVYFILKLIYWNSFTLGIAPLIIGLFFFSSLQLFFLGLIGEYVGAIYTRVDKKPLVVEKERINFDESDRRDLSKT